MPCLLLLLAVAAPRFYRAGPAPRLRGQQRPGAGGGGGDDAGDPLPPDRHLDRLDLQHLRRGRRAAGPGRACRSRWSAWGRSLAGGGLGAINGVLVARLGLAVDRGDAGHPGDRARVAALRARGRVRPRPAAGFPVVRAGPGGRPVGRRGDRARGLRGVRLGPAQPGGGPGRLRDRLGPRGRAAGGHPARGESSSASSSRWGRWPGWPRC